MTAERIAELRLPSHGSIGKCVPSLRRACHAPKSVTSARSRSLTSRGARHRDAHQSTRVVYLTRGRPLTQSIGSAGRAGSARFRPVLRSANGTKRTFVGFHGCLARGLVRTVLWVRAANSGAKFAHSFRYLDGPKSTTVPIVRVWLASPHLSFCFSDILLFESSAIKY